MPLCPGRLYRLRRCLPDEEGSPVARRLEIGASGSFTAILTRGCIFVPRDDDGSSTTSARTRFLRPAAVWEPSGPGCQTSDASVWEERPAPWEVASSCRLFSSVPEFLRPTRYLLFPRHGTDPLHKQYARTPLQTSTSIQQCDIPDCA